MDATDRIALIARGRAIAEHAAAITPTISRQIIDELCDAIEILEPEIRKDEAEQCAELCEVGWAEWDAHVECYTKAGRAMAQLLRARARAHAGEQPEPLT